MFILIDGFWGSGKSMIKMLLNGHPNLCVSPIQESIVSAFYNNRNLFRHFKYKDLRIIRKILSDSYYYDLQRLKFNNFNFFIFEKDLFNSISNLKKWKPNLLIVLIYKKIIFHLFKIKKSKKIVFLENNEVNSYEFFLNNFKNSKIIYVERDIEGIIASLIKRKKKKDDFFTDSYSKFNFKYLVNKLKVPSQVLQNNSQIKFLKKKYPKKIYVCNFNDLILNNKKEMKKICNHINIPFNKKVLTPNKFNSNINQSEVGLKKIIHDPKKILNENEIIFLKNFHKFSFNSQIFKFVFYQIKYKLIKIFKKLFYNI